MACGLAFIPAQRSDAQVSVGIGVGYPSYGYRYYLVWIRLLPISDTTGLIGYYGYYNGRTYYNGRHRYYRHHRNHHRYYRY